MATRSTGLPLRVKLTLLLLLAGLQVYAALANDPYEAITSLGLGDDFKQGYVLRADTWSGDLPADGTKKIEHTLLRGNDYRFYAYSTTKGARISLHIEDQSGAYVETRNWQKEKDELSYSGADVSPKTTGRYYLIVKVERSPAERTAWCLLYAYK